MNKNKGFNLWVRTTVILTMLLSVILATGPARGLASPADDIVPSPSSFWYYVGKEQVSLPLATDEVAVRFAAGLTTNEQEAIIEAVGNLAPLAEGTQLPVPELTLLKTKAGLSEDDLLQTLDDLRADPGVVFAYPVFAFPDARMTLTDQFVAQFKPGATAEAVAAFNAANGVEVVEAIRLPNTYVLRVGAGADTLAMANLYHESDLTIYSTPDFVRFLTRQFTPNDTHYPNQWGMENTGTNPPDGVGTADADMDASDAWDVELGAPDIVIAIIDEGVELDHEDLDDKLVAHYSAVPGDVNGGDPNNTWDAHGTNCAGIATAETNNNQGVAGVCANCSLMAVQIAYSNYDGGPWITSDSWIANAMIWAVDHDADVLSNSWGGGSPSSLIDDAIDHAVTNGRGGLGCSVLFAAGNGDSSPVIYPARNNQTVAVGATSPCDERKNPSSCDGEWWWGSNHGTDLDIVAPGVEWWATDMMGAAGYGPGNYYDHMNGTSSATPAAAGLAGLILSYRPCLTEAQVQEIIEQSAEDQVGLPGEDVPGWDQYMGWGRINAYNALLLADDYPCEEVCGPHVYFDIYHDVGDSAGQFTALADLVVNELGGLFEEKNQFIDGAALADYNVLVIPDPDLGYAFDPAEIVAIADFVAGGGRLIVLGEWQGAVDTDTLNDLLAGVGVNISLNYDMVYDVTDNEAGTSMWPLIHQFAPHPLTNGVGWSALYASASLNVNDPAIAIASGDDDTYTGAVAMEGLLSNAGMELAGTAPQDIYPGAPIVMAYSPAGAGDVFVVGDSGIWEDGDPDGDGVISLDEYDNHQLAFNVFDLGVCEEPTCVARILFDETHGWAYDGAVGDYTIEDGFSELAAFLESNGHVVDSLRDPNPFDYATISQYDVLVLMLPKEYYSIAEKAAIAQFVNEGGRLVTIDEWGGFAGISQDILNEVHAYLDDGLYHNYDMVHDPTDFVVNDFWSLIHNFPPHPVNGGVGTVIEYAGSSLQVSGPAYGTAFGDDDTYALPSVAAEVESGAGAGMTVAPGRTIDRTEPDDGGLSALSADPAFEAEAAEGVLYYNPVPLALVNDGGFENGPPPASAWDEWSDTGGEWILDPSPYWGIPAHSGIYAFWAGGYYGGQANSNGVGQSIPVPVDNPVLSFWYNAYRPDQDDDYADILEVKVDGTTVWALDMVQANDTYPDWVEVTVDLSAWADSTIYLSFEATSYGDLTGNVLVDDVGWFEEQPPEIIVQAMANVGAGDVFAIGDANLWDTVDYDENAIVSLYEYDNAQLALNVFAGVCEVPPPPCVAHILFDETHGFSWEYIIEGSYSELAALLESNGNVVDSLRDPDPFDYATISQYDVLVLVLPVDYYSADEKAAIAQFVEEGGRLVVIGERQNFGGSTPILNEVIGYLGTGLVINDDIVYDPTDNDGQDYWPLIHNFPPHPVNGGVGAVVEYAGASLQVWEPAYGTAFGDDDTYVVPSVMAGAESDTRSPSVPQAPIAPERTTDRLSDLPHTGNPGTAAPGDVIETFGNTWDSSTIGLVYNPSGDFVRYAHESDPNPTIYDVDYPVPHNVLGSISLSAVNPGWPTGLNNRDGAGYDYALDTYFLPDYNGDLDNADDNIVEINAVGAILNAWETDGAGNDSYDGSFIAQIIDIAVVPGAPTRYFAAAAGDGNVMYEIDLIKGGWWAPNSWGTLGTCTVPGLSDNVGIDYDAHNGVLYHSDFDSTNIVVTDLDCNMLDTFTCDSPAGSNTGVTFIEGKWPPEIWVTDFSSNSTTRCEAFGQQPEGIIVQAMANLGAGDVFAIGDGGLWSNDDSDGDAIISLYEYDNAQLALNVFAKVCEEVCPVALFKDNINPWTAGAEGDSSAAGMGIAGFDPDPNEQILQAWGIPYDVFSAADIGQADLSPYCKVIVASQQPYGFYETLSANRSWFEGWIANGGMLEFHGAAYGGDDWSGLPMPGGFTMFWDPQNDVTIVDYAHPILNDPNPITGPELDGWSYSTHGWLIDLPPEANYIIAHEPSTEPATAEFGLGEGCVVATVEPLEWALGLEYSPILENFLLHDQCYVQPAPKCVLLVDDDDNNPDVRPHYADALNALGYGYDVFEVPEDGSGDGPPASLMANYDIVIWFSGHDYAGPNANDEAELAAYLDGGGHLWLVSQDYLYNMGLTPFGTDYLHIASYANDVAQTVVTGDNAFGGLGPYTLDYPFTNYSDVVNPDGASELAFAGDVGDAAIEYANRTIFFGYPWEAIAEFGDRVDVMARAIYYLGGCVEEEEPILDVWPETCEATLYEGGSTVQTLEIRNVGGGLLEYSISEAPDVPWLQEDPTSGVVSGGDTDYVDVSFDAAGLAPGSYTADLVIDHNDGLPDPYILPCTLNVAACEGTTVFIDPPAVDVSIGAIFTVEVWIADVVDLGGFEFDLLYDPSVVWVLDVTLGDFPESTGRTWFEVGPDIDNVTGLTSYGAGSFGAQLAGPDGTGVIALVTLQAMAQGSSALHLDAVQVTDTDGILIEPLCLLDGYVTVIPCQPVYGADFSWSDPIRTSRSTTFEGTVGGGTPPFNFTWDFGDGFGDAGVVVEHTYDHAVANIHDVLVDMDVTNGCGADGAEYWGEVWLFFDFDRDCDVDIVDVMATAARWGCDLGEPCYDPYYDVDLDGDIDIVDIMQTAAWWSWTCP